MILEEDDALGHVLNFLTGKDIHILNLQKREPTLEDVFVDLVGRSMSEVESAENNRN
jgi:ABC-2 type transport system ATP-binding protein